MRYWGQCGYPRTAEGGGQGWAGDGHRAADFGAEMADLLDQVVAEGFGGGRLAGAFGLWDLIGGAQ